MTNISWTSQRAADFRLHSTPQTSSYIWALLLLQFLRLTHPEAPDISQTIETPGGIVSRFLIQWLGKDCKDKSLISEATLQTLDPMMLERYKTLVYTAKSFQRRERGGGEGDDVSMYIPTRELKPSTEPPTQILGLVLFF